MKVETDIAQGMPYFHMVGLLSSEVREAKERVRTALKNSGGSIPMNRITVNLSPADRKKEGAGFDLPIALGLLCAMGRIQEEHLKDSIVIGELGLDGEIKSVKGILPIVAMAKEKGYKRCIVPKENVQEGGIVKGIEVTGFANITDVLSYFEKGNEEVVVRPYDADYNNEEIECRDYGDIVGQEAVKRALLIAASGWHNLMMIGSPGVGKSMLASRLSGIMPNMSDKEKMEVSNIHSICGLLKNNRLITGRPFAAPYHTVTSAALVGGGSIPVPGQITIAHRGV